MTPFDSSRWRPAAFLPRGDVRDGALLFVIAVLCFLASLTALGVIASDRAARGWTQQLTGSATVIVRPRAGETPDSAAARAAEALSGVIGVSEVRALEKAKAEALACAAARRISPGTRRANRPASRASAHCRRE